MDFRKECKARGIPAEILEPHLATTVNGTVQLHFPRCSERHSFVRVNVRRLTDLVAVLVQPWFQWYIFPHPGRPRKVEIYRTGRHLNAWHLLHAQDND